MASFFAQNLVHLRTEKRLTQEKLADELGMTRASIDSYEGGRAMPPYKKLKLIAEAFGHTVPELTEKKLWEEAEHQQTELFTKNISPQLDLEIPQQSSLLNQIALVPATMFAPYAKGLFDPYSDHDTRLSIPLAEKGEYLAFESNDDFPLPKSILICIRQRNFEGITDGKQHVLVTHEGQIFYRKIYNQLNTRNVLVLTPEVDGQTTIDLPKQVVKEIWQVKAFVAYQMPDYKADISKAKELLEALQAELQRLI